MGTTITLHCHDDETVGVVRFGNTGWPHIIVEGEDHNPIADVAIIMDPAEVAGIGTGLLDYGEVSAALIPAELAVLARIVREHAPQFVLAEAGLYKADAAESDTEAAAPSFEDMEGPYLACCDLCGSRVGVDDHLEGQSFLRAHWAHDHTGAFLRLKVGARIGYVQDTMTSVRTAAVS